MTFFKPSSFCLVLLCCGLMASCGRADLVDRRDAGGQDDVSPADMVNDLGSGLSDMRPGGPDVSGPDGGVPDEGGGRPDASMVLCTDEVENGQETDVDCGGPVCQSCLDGQRCLVPSDCRSGQCARGVCLPRVPKKKIGEMCQDSEECEFGLCQQIGMKTICTFPCNQMQPCPQSTDVCLLGSCVPPDFCEDDSGLGVGPGCVGSPCDTCAAQARCLTEAPGKVTCICLPGYLGDGMTCQDQDECTLPPAETCGDVIHACVNTPGSFECRCAPGYATAPGAKTCRDLDECQGMTPPCGPQGTCTNTPGGFECACAAGYRFDPGLRDCVDVDECDEGLITCSLDATCTNTPGGASCTCNMGYAGDGFDCEDVDECAIPAVCLPPAQCINLPGSYRCTTCPPGTMSGPNGTCQDIDECATNQDDCDPNATCTNTPGSFTCACIMGYMGDGKTCMPVNLPALGDTCTNPFVVTSGTAYSAMGDTTGATNDYSQPRNACPTSSFLGRGAASPDQVYAFTPTRSGTYHIKVQDSYSSTALITTDCQSIQTSCLASDAFDPELTLSLTAGTTYFIVIDGVGNIRPTQGAYAITVDLDECASGSANCPMGAQCVDVFGSFACTCPAGSVQSGNQCVDVDECATGQDDCDPNATCTNTPGSFTCACNTGFVGPGNECWDPLALGETCANPFSITTVPFVVSNGNTADAHPDYSYGNNQCPGQFGGRGAASADEVYTFTPTLTGRYRFDLFGTWGVNLYVRQSCTLASSCLGADARFFGQGSVSVTVDMTAGQTYAIVVDGSSNTVNQNGTYVLSGTKL